MGACDGNLPPEPDAPIPPAPAGVTPGASTGPTRIVLVAAAPAAGSAIAGCGSGADGCVGRIRMTFRLTPTGSGTVLWCAAFLHATDKTSCLQGRTTGFPLRAGEAQTIEVVFDLPAGGDRCRTPLDITDLDLAVEGTAAVASRQEWAVRYRLLP
jgi:hypothetical protein